MMSEEKTNRIKYALHSTTWDADSQSSSELCSTATRVLATEYTDSMHGNLYCPSCFTNLTRTPKNKPYFTNGRRACFAHLPSSREVPCDLRSTKPEGKLYLTEEDAVRAIANEELVVISSFLDVQPEAPAGAGEYNQTPVESVAGPLANIPIARHRGMVFKLPTRMTTVASICRRFDENLYRYYFFPGARSAVLLMDAITDITNVTEPTDAPALYFGRIKNSFNAGSSPKPTNIRMTELYSNPIIKDFYIKVVDRLQTEKGISDSSVGRYVVFWGNIATSGIGLCAKQLKWGEFALLPTKYEHLISSDYL